MLIDQISAAPTDPKAMFAKRKELDALFKNLGKSTVQKQTKETVETPVDNPAKYSFRYMKKPKPIDRFVDPEGRDWLLIATKGTLEKIALEVIERHGISMIDLKSSRRQSNLVLARFEFCWRARKETGKSLPEIGRFLNGKDHTTVLHSANKYEAIRKFLLTGVKDKILNTTSNYDLSKVITEGV